MEEENKQEVVVKEEPKEEKTEEAKDEQKQESLDKVSEYSLITFILVCIGFLVCSGWIVGGVACLVLGVISLMRCKNCAAVKEPYKTFDKVSFIVAIVDIVLGGISIAGYTVSFIYNLIH